MKPVQGIAAAVGVLVASSVIAAAQPAPRPFRIVEASISGMQQAMRDGRITSRELVLQYLARIATYEPVLHAVLAVNPDALADAGRLDRERASGHVRGPLHGIPVALKDNIQTTMMPTTGGALAFAGFVPPYEATLAANLRAAQQIAFVSVAACGERRNAIGKHRRDGAGLAIDVDVREAKRRRFACGRRGNNPEHEFRGAHARVTRTLRPRHGDAGVFENAFDDGARRVEPVVRHAVRVVDPDHK